MFKSKHYGKFSAIKEYLDKRISTPQPFNVSVSNADELLKYKQLLNANAIILEEYEAKKKQLLGL